MRVLVADRKPERRRATIEALRGMRVIGAVSDLHAAAHAIYGDTPDAIVTGADLADGGVFELLYLARRAPKSPTTLIVGDDVNRDDWCRLINAGAHRIVAPDEVRRAVQTLASRGKNYSDDLALLDRVSMTTGGSRPSMRWLALALVMRSRRRAPSQAVDLARVTQDVLDMLAGAVGPRVMVVTDLQPRRVMGVRGELEQLVAVLLLNALDAIPPCQVLHVAVHSHAGSAVLEVAGDGHPPPDWLGLRLARRIVEHHKGDLRVMPHNANGLVTRVVLPAGL